MTRLHLLVAAALCAIAPRATAQTLTADTAKSRKLRVTPRDAGGATAA